MNLTKSCFVVLCVALPMGVVQATQISGVSVAPTSAKVGEEVKITVSGNADSANCGIRVEFGDGSPNENFVLADKGGQFPFTLSKSYDKPGSYKVKALARKVGFTFGCGEGGAETVVTVAPAGSAKAGPVAASCPEGWVLASGQVDSSKGFTCAPKKPMAKLDCGPGLQYFEKEGLIGCKSAKRK